MLQDVTRLLSINEEVFTGSTQRITQEAAQESTDITSWCDDCLSSHVMHTVTKNKGELSDERKEEND